MTYEELISTITSIVNDETIKKDGLFLTYVLDDTQHLAMNEELYIKTNGVIYGFEPSDEFEAQIGGILIKFIKRQ
jgi:hypothetical protein